MSPDQTERPVGDSAAPICNEKRETTGAVVVFRDRTEEGAAQQALHDSEARFRSIFDNSPIGMSMTEVAGGVRVNKAFAEILGYSEDELRSKTWQEITHPDDVQESADAIQALVDGRQSRARWEKRYIHKSGRVVWTDISTAVHRDQRGKALFLMTTISDITQWRTRENELRRSRVMLARTEELAQLGSWELDMATESVTWSDETFRIFGLAPADVAPAFAEHSRCYHPDDLRRLEAAIGAAIDTGTPFEVELRMTRSDGETRVCLGRGYLSSALDATPHIVGSLQDITERKRVDEALQQALRQLDSVLSSLCSGVLVVSAEGIVDLANQAFCDIFHLPESPAELRGWTSPQLLRRIAAEYADPADMLARARDYVAHETPVRGEEISMRDGRVFLLDYIPIVVAGRTRGRIWHHQDVTELKRAEAARMALGEQLRASQKMEAIGGLAGGIAHDFNNLLAVILGYTGFAIGALRDGEPLKGDLLEVRKAADRAAELTRQLLAFSRKQILQPIPLDLNQTAAGIERMLRRILGEDIDFVQVLAPDLGLTLADPGQIEMVIMNLVVNARDAMPGGGTLTIETSNVEIDDEYAVRHVAVEPGSYVQLAVTDTGRGMDEHTRSRIFEPFFTTKEKGKGTGLGLSTVYGIVKQSGGNIWVYSEVGKGTTFKICLPRKRAATATTAAEPLARSRPLTGTETILVVDDEESLRQVTERALGVAGYTVLTAANGDEAIMVSTRYDGEIHLLLTDVVMPGMSGRALADRLAKARPSLEVLYMSGYTDNAVVHHGVLDQGTYFISKPFRGDALARKVREVLDNRKIARSQDLAASGGRQPL